MVEKIFRKFQINFTLNLKNVAIYAKKEQKKNSKMFLKVTQQYI